MWPVSMNYSSSTWNTWKSPVRISENHAVIQTSYLLNKRLAHGALPIHLMIQLVHTGACGVCNVWKQKKLHKVKMMKQIVLLTESETTVVCAWASHAKYKTGKTEDKVVWCICCDWTWYDVHDTGYCDALLATPPAQQMIQLWHTKRRYRNKCLKCKWKKCGYTVLPFHWWLYHKIIKIFLKSYLSATKPKMRAPRNFPRDTAICTVDLRGVRLHTRSHYNQKKKHK